MLEFPDEKDRMTTLQELTIVQRENFLKLVFNLTSELNEEEIEALKTYIIHGPDFDAIDYDVRTIMLSTNRLPESDIQLSSQMTNIPKVRIVFFVLLALFNDDKFEYKSDYSGHLKLACSYYIRM